MVQLDVIFPGNCIEGQRKTTKIFSQDGRFPGHDFYQGSHELRSRSAKESAATFGNVFKKGFLECFKDYIGTILIRIV